MVLNGEASPDVFMGESWVYGGCISTELTYDDHCACTAGHLLPANLQCTRSICHFLDAVYERIGREKVTGPYNCLAGLRGNVLRSLQCSSNIMEHSSTNEYVEGSCASADKLLAVEGQYGGWMFGRNDMVS